MCPKNNNNNNNEFFPCFTHFCGNPVFSFLFSQLCCPTCSKAENYLKQDQAKNHPSQSSRGGGCFALEICVTKPLWHLGIRRCYKILCKQSNLVWVYCFLNDFSLFRINYFACCHNKNPLKYYSSILRHCNWC